MKLVAIIQAIVFYSATFYCVYMLWTHFEGGRFMAIVLFIMSLLFAIPLYEYGK